MRKKHSSENDAIENIADTSVNAESVNVEVTGGGEAVITEQPPMRAKKNRMNNQDRYALAAFVFILPFIIGFAVFKLAPCIISIQLSFSTIVNPMHNSMQWVGWYNYLNQFTSNTRLITSLTSMITSTAIQLPVINISAFFFAILLNKEIKGRGFFRAVFFFPVVIGTGYALQKLMSNSGSGVASTIKLPGELLKYLGDDFEKYVATFFTTFTTTLWKTGVQILLFLTGLQGIPFTLYESAYCDGATEWEQFWKITLPMMTPTILLCLVYTLIARFNDSDNPMRSYYVSDIVSGTFMQESEKALYGVLTGADQAAVSWVYAIVSMILIGIVFLIMRPIIKKTTGGDM